MNLFKKNKKGNAILDGLTLLVVIFVFILASVFGYSVFTTLNTDIQNDASITMNESKEISSSLYTKYPVLLDNLILFAFTLLVLFTLISVFMLDSHPIFFFISIILLAGLFLVAIILADAYDDIMQDPGMAVYANAFTYTTWIMTHLLQTMIGVGFILTIVLFIKFKG